MGASPACIDTASNGNSANDIWHLTTSPTSTTLCALSNLWHQRSHDSTDVTPRYTLWSLMSHLYPPDFFSKRVRSGCFINFQTAITGPTVVRAYREPGLCKKLLSSRSSFSAASQRHQHMERRSPYFPFTPLFGYSIYRAAFFLIHRKPHGTTDWEKFVFFRVQR